MQHNVIDNLARKKLMDYLRLNSAMHSIGLILTVCILIGLYAAPAEAGSKKALLIESQYKLSNQEIIILKNSSSSQFLFEQESPQAFAIQFAQLGYAYEFGERCEKNDKKAFIFYHFSALEDKMIGSKFLQPLLPKVVSGYENTCSICLEDFFISEKADSIGTTIDLLKEPLTLLPCSHLFHAQCLANWPNKEKTCPICRRKIDLPENHDP
jgi:hypothetical protein